MKEEIKKKYIVVENKKEAPGVVTLKLLRIEGEGKKEKSVVPNYCPGQFITVYFSSLGTPEGKAYSISSAPYEKTLNITVKAMGTFSYLLVALKPGDTVTASLPYGFFYSESQTTNLVMIASGIGVAPFRSMIFCAIKKTPQRKLTLFYSVQKKEDVLFQKEFKALEAVHDNFRVFYFLTQEVALPLGRVTGRMRIDDILGNAQGRCERVTSHDDREFLICGSISFVRDMWRGLRAQEISETSLYTEAFFSH